MVVGIELGRPIEILLIEDNPADVRLTEEAVSEGTVPCNLTVAWDSEMAMRILRNENQYSNNPRPDLIFLDLNLPKQDGRQTLEEIKTDPQLKRIPVVILTTSSAETDILQSYDLHANCYIIKPVDFDEFTRIIKLVEQFWLGMVQIPSA